MSESEARRRCEIVNRLGLHARAASKLVQLAGRFPCEIWLAREGQEVNGKSVMGVLLLCGSQGSEIELIARGERADEAVEALSALIADRFGEGE